MVNIIFLVYYYKKDILNCIESRNRNRYILSKFDKI